MNILLVTDTYLPYYSGVSTHTDSIARYMASKGHRVTLVAPKPVISGAARSAEGLTIVYSPSIADVLFEGNALAIFPFTLLVIRGIFKRTKFDVVHTQTSGPMGLSALINARMQHVPVIGAYLSTPEQASRVIWGLPERILSPLIRSIMSFVYNRYDVLTVLTQTYARYMEGMAIKRPISVISSGVDIEAFHPAPLNVAVRQEHGISTDATVFLFLGRLDVDKNVATLIRALSHVDKGVRLLIIGQGKLEKHLHSLADKLKVNEKIIWVKSVLDDDIMSYYHGADCFAIMSPYEIQSIVTLQAVACGLPVIAARAGALPELVHEGENGFLIGAYDHENLAKKMNYLAKHKEMRRRFAKASRKISQSHHKPHVLDQLELLYQDVANEFRFEKQMGESSQQEQEPADL